MNSQEHQQLVLDASEALLNALGHDPTYNAHLFNYYFDNAQGALIKYSTGTLQRIKAATGLNGRPATILMNEIMDGLWTETEINDHLVLARAPANQHLFHDNDFTAYIKGLSQYPSLCVFEDYDDYPKKRQQHVYALVNTVHLAQGTGHNAYLVDDDFERVCLLHNEGLIDLLLNPENYERTDIVSVIKDHQTFDIDRIKELLDFEVPAMRSGVL